MGILDHAKVTDKGIADAVRESLQMAFIIMLSTEMTAAVIVLGEKKLFIDNLQMLEWGQKVQQSSCPPRGRTTCRSH